MRCKREPFRHNPSRAKRNEQPEISRIQPSAPRAGCHPSHVRDSSRFFDLVVFLVISFFVSAWKRMLVLCALR